MTSRSDAPPSLDKIVSDLDRMMGGELFTTVPRAALDDIAHSNDPTKLTKGGEWEPIAKESLWQLAFEILNWRNAWPTIRAAAVSEIEQQDGGGRAPGSSAPCVALPPRDPTPAMEKVGAQWWTACLNNYKPGNENAAIMWMAMYDAWRHERNGE